jgi:hypothetical protein
MACTLADNLASTNSDRVPHQCAQDVFTERLHWLALLFFLDLSL